jgi:hypothetical protein
MRSVTNPGMTRCGYPRQRIDTFHEQTPRSKNVWSLAPGERALGMSVSSEARLGARAGRAQPGARAERVHRRDDPAMRATGTRVGRVGRIPRLDQGIVRHQGRRAEPDPARRVGGAPCDLRSTRPWAKLPAHLPVLATNRGAGCVLHLARRRHGAHSLRSVPAGPVAGLVSRARSHELPGMV